MVVDVVAVVVAVVDISGSAAQRLSFCFNERMCPLSETIVPDRRSITSPCFSGGSEPYLEMIDAHAERTFSRECLRRVSRSSMVLGVLFLT